MKDGDTDVESPLHLGNPSDVAEIRADLLVRVVQTTNFGPEVKDVHARIEWWLDEGEDEYVTLSFLYSCALTASTFFLVLLC